MIGIGSSVGNYRVVKKLGSGAMGSVYLAEHPQIGKRVALKVIHPDLADNAEMVSRFFNEARAVNQIGHEHIVEVLDFGQTPEGDNFIIMELLEGEGLGDRIKARRMLEVNTMLWIASQIADGVAASHAHGIIHRDLKPDNVFLVSRDGDPDFVKILDFGLAKLMQSAVGGADVQHKTRAGSVLGTPHYMAPEQCEGKPDIDHRVDIYALGCIMFQMVCGRVPFPGEGFGQVLIKHLREAPEPPSDINPLVPISVERIILRALEKKKADRFQSMDEVAAALRDPDSWLAASDGPAVPALPAAAAPLSDLGEPDPGLASAQTMAGVSPHPLRPAAFAASSTPEGVAEDDAPATVMEELPFGVLEALRAAANQPLPPLSSGTASALRPHQSTVVGKVPAAVAVAPSPTEQVRQLRAPPGVTVRGRLLVIVGVAVGAVVLLVSVGLFLRQQQVPRSGATALVPAAVVVDSVPPEAEVLRDGRPLGTTPVILRFAPGSTKASLTLRKEGYADARREVGETSESPTTVTLEPLKPAPAPAPAP